MPKRDRLEQLTQHVAAASLDDARRPSRRAPAAAGAAGRAVRFDLVLANGRVIDPESGTDEVLNVGIVGDKIVAVGPASEVNTPSPSPHPTSPRGGAKVDPADAATTRDCAGHIVCPGFIDLHAHGQNNESARLQAQDGVTTHLELEVGTYPVDEFLAQREALGAIINFGSSVGHIPARAAAISGVTVPFSVADDPCCMIETKQMSVPAHKEAANPSQLRRLWGMLGDGLDQGGIGIGAGIVYTPGANHTETYELAKTVAKHGVALFVHIRGRGPVGLEDFHEMFSNAATAGASIHICHTLSSARAAHQSGVSDLLEMATKLNEQGIDISFEQYPYPYGMTNLRTEQSSVWNPNQLLRQVKRKDTGEIMTGPAAAQAGRTGTRLLDAVKPVSLTRKLSLAVDGSPSEVEGEVLVGGWSWLETGEFLTEESYDKYYAQGGLSYGHWSDKEAACMDSTMAHPMVLVASDGIPFVDGAAHPRGAGTFCRFLGIWARQKKLVSWSEAIRKMTVGPALRLQRFVPMMRTKGRIQVGMDADITVFDPETVIDKATLAEPSLPSVGVAHVLVNGVFVVDGGELCEGVLPGRAVRGQSQLAAGRDDRGGGRRAVKVQKTTSLFSSMLEGQSADFLSPEFDC